MVIYMSRIDQIKRAVMVISAMIAVYILVYITGGIKYVYSHTMYIPILLAALFFGRTGGLICGIIAGILLGPFMPIDTVTNEAQSTLNWMYRLLVFASIGLIGGHYVGALKSRNKQLHDLAILDDLTQVYNRRHLHEFIQNISREQYPLGLVFIDINNLKFINDAFGHDAGDELLIFTVNAMRKYLQDEDLLFRLGGDEFLVVIPNVSKKTIELFTEAVSIDVKKYLIRHLTTSISFGWYISLDVEEKVETAISKAERDMYNYKLSHRGTMRSNALEVLMNTLHEKDPYSKEHSDRVAMYSEHLAKWMGLDNLRVKEIYIAAKIHDVGKVLIPSAILEKPGALTPQEYEKVKEHPLTAFRILSNLREMEQIAIMVKYHHEHFDGKGYPNGLKGEEIPLGARIISVVDAFDAMTSKRYYRLTRTVDEAKAELKRCSATQFDPEIVKVFLAHIDDLRLDHIANNAR